MPLKEKIMSSLSTMRSFSLKKVYGDSVDILGLVTNLEYRDKF